MAKRVSELTNGRVAVQVFHNGALGDDAEALEQTQAGALDINMTSIIGGVIPIATVMDLPFVFRDEAHWEKAVDGHPGQVVAEGAKGTGIVVLTWYLGGWRDTYTTKKAVNAAGDLKGLKLRTIQTPAYVKLFTQLGAISTPLPFSETYLALQQGTIDGAETALTSMIDAKHYEVSKYVALTHHGLSSTQVIFSEIVWNKLPADLQAAIMQAAADSAVVQREALKKAAEKTVTDLKGFGMEFTEPDRAPFQAASKEIWKEIVTEQVSQNLLDEISGL